MLHSQNNIFKKRFSNYDILNHLYFGLNFGLFGGTALGRFSSCFFLIFCRRATMVAVIFTQSENYKLIYESQFRHFMKWGKICITFGIFYDQL